MKPFKQKKCKVCKGTFEPRVSLQAVCSPKCAQAHAEQKRVKESVKKVKQERQERREAILKAKSRGQWLKETQAAFNAYIRHRDNLKPEPRCISCGAQSGKQNAGHYRSVGSAPELRFEPMNCHLQCERCNSHLSGNLIMYRKNLLELIGEDTLNWLEGKHEPKKYTIPELKVLKSEYQAKLKELKG